MVAGKINNSENIIDNDRNSIVQNGGNQQNGILNNGGTVENRGHLNNDNLRTTILNDDIDFFNDDEEVNIDFYKKRTEQEKIDNEKSLFIKHLEKKIYGIEKRMRYINHKYVDYYNYYKRLNGIVIVLSACLTLFEASTNIIDYQIIDSHFWRNCFQMLPLFASTLVSLIATYIKFQKYQENMERLIVTEEKGIIAISKLKKIREIVYFDIQNLKDIKNTYLEETYQFYNEVNIKISIELDENDYKKYYKKMSDVDVKIGNTFVNKSKKINKIVDRHIQMENKYKLYSESDTEEDDNNLTNIKKPIPRRRRPSYNGSCVSP